MATTNVTIQIDETVKTELQSLMADLGMDVNTFFTIAAKQAVREQSVPFRITREIPNHETIEAFEEIEELKKHPEQAKTYNSFGELLKEVMQDV